MNYRIFGALLASASLLLGTVSSELSWGQSNRIVRVGILSFGQSLSGEQAKQWWEPFRRTLREQGWIEGQNVSLEFRDARGNAAALTEAASEFVRLKVDVIVGASAPAVRAAHQATRTIPIVGVDFTNDPVAEGYVESYGRPGGNLTGVFLDAPEFAGKWLELIKAMVPKLSRVAVIWDPAPGSTHLRALQRVAPSFGVRLQVLEVRKPDDLDGAFTAFRGRPHAVIILPSPMTYEQSERLAKLTVKHRLPATSMARLFAEAGGTASYGPDLAAGYERCAVLVAKILGGAKPAGLPVERPTKVQLVVNLKTIKALGLTMPDSVLLRADEVVR